MEQSYPFVRRFKNLRPPTTDLGYIQDDHIIDNCQKESMKTFGIAQQFEQEGYFSEHPEISAMLTNYFEKALQKDSKLDDLGGIAKFFTRPWAELDKEVRDRLGLSADEPYYTGAKRFEIDTKKMRHDLWEIHEKHHYKLPFDETKSESSREFTQSSSFISLMTSHTTEITLESSPERTPTTSEVFLGILNKLVDKVAMTGLEDADILYDTAYVEVMNAVENAMELTVVDIKQDIEAMLSTAFRLFNVIIEDREKKIAEHNWEKRMRKKLKRSLRRIDNFKGYETPQTPKSHVSSHESYKIPPPLPCQCHPQFYYNRYPKDRFGIYLPRKETFCSENVTLTPTISLTDVDENDDSQNITTSSEKEGKPTKTSSKTSVASASIKKKIAKAKEEKIEVKKPRSNETTSNASEAINKKEQKNCEVPKSKLFNKVSGNINKEEDNEDFYTKRLKMLSFIKKADAHALPEPVKVPPKPESRVSKVKSSNCINFEENRTTKGVRRYAVAYV